MLIFQSALAVPTTLGHHFILRNVKLNIATPNKVNIYVYLLKNNSNRPATFEIKPASNIIHINSRLSTCNGYLGPYSTCNIYLSYAAPKTLGKHKTYLNISSAGQNTRLPLTFKVKSHHLDTMISKSSQLTWHQLNSPSGGIISDVFIDPSNPKIIYVAVWGAGVYKSSNGGKTFTHINSSQHSVYTPDQFAYSDGSLYLLTDIALYVTKDGGDSWTWLLSNGLGAPTINEIVAHDSTLYVAATNGVYRLVPATSQQPAHLALTGKFHVQNAEITCVLPLDNGTIYAGTSTHGIYKSTDNGHTWHSINNRFTAMNRINTLMNVDGTIYMGTSNYSSDGAIFRSSDGEHFIRSDMGIGSYGVNVLAHDRNRLYAGTAPSLDSNDGGGFFISSDGGRTWQPGNTGLDYKTVNSIAVTPTGNYLATMGDLYQSVNGGESWQAMDNGIDGQTISDVLLTPKDTILVETLEGSIYYSKDIGLTWALGKGVDAIGTAPIISSRLGETKSGVIYSATNSHPFTLYISRDDGQTWIKTSQLKTPIIMMSLNSHNSKIYLGTANSGIYVSSDLGNTWQQLTTKPLPQTMINMTFINNMLYASTEASDNSDSIYKILASGDSDWHSANGNLPHGLGPIDQLLGINDGTTNGVLYAASSWLVGVSHSGLYSSIDGGMTWKFLSAQLPQKYFSSLIVKGDMIIIGSRYHVYISTDDGQDWQEADAGINLHIMPLLNLTSNGNMLIANSLRQIYQASIN